MISNRSPVSLPDAEQCNVGQTRPRNKGQVKRRRTLTFVVAGTVSLLLHWFIFFMRHGPLQHFNGKDQHSEPLNATHNMENALTEEQSKNKSLLTDTIALSEDDADDESLKAAPSHQTKGQKQKASQSQATQDVPNVLIVGAQKAGTTAVQSWIDLHPNVCKAASVPDGNLLKEVHFFNNDLRYSKGPEFYRQHYRHCTKRTTILIDSTPDYLPHAARVRETYERFGRDYVKDLKLLMILREPVAREYSWFNHMVMDTTKPNPPPYTQRVLDGNGRIKPFEKYLNQSVLPDIDSSFGQYAAWLRLWMDHFDRKQILVLSYDELMSDPVSFLGRIQTFLGLYEGKVKDEVAVRNKKTGKIQSPPLYCTPQARLHKAFRAANKNLYELLDRHIGPEMEQRPFPRFKLSPCTPDKPKRLQGNNTSH